MNIGAKRLERELEETRSRLDKACERRDELADLLERVVQSEASQAQKLLERELQINRERSELEARAGRTDVPALTATDRQRIEQQFAELQTKLEAEQRTRAELEQDQRDATDALAKLRAELNGAREQAAAEKHARLELEERLGRDSAEATGEQDLEKPPAAHVAELGPSPFEARADAGDDHLPEGLQSVRRAAERAEAAGDRGAAAWFQALSKAAEPPAANPEAAEPSAANPDAPAPPVQQQVRTRQRPRDPRSGGFFRDLANPRRRARLDDEGASDVAEDGRGV